jgi:hypothetical protein
MEPTDVLAHEDIAIEKGGRKRFNEDFVFVGESLDSGNSRLLIQSLYHLLITD